MHLLFWSSWQCHRWDLIFYPHSDTSPHGSLCTHTHTHTQNMHENTHWSMIGNGKGREVYTCTNKLICLVLHIHKHLQLSWGNISSLIIHLYMTCLGRRVQWLGCQGSNLTQGGLRDGDGITLWAEGKEMAGGWKCVFSGKLKHQPRGLEK